MLIQRIKLQIRYLLGLQVRPKVCKRCGTSKHTSKRGTISYFTPPNAKPCPSCSKYVTIVSKEELQHRSMH